MAIWSIDECKIYYYYWYLFLKKNTWFYLVNFCRGLEVFKFKFKIIGKSGLIITNNGLCNSHDFKELNSFYFKHKYAMQA